jgi:hypothetical protein
MKKRIFVASLLTTILMAAFFSPAFAKRPTTEPFSVPISDPFDVYCEDEDGVEFKLFDLEEVVTGWVTTFYGQDGSPVRMHTHFEFEGTALNTKTGTVLRSHNTSNKTEYLTGDKGLVETGAFVKLTAPGKGVVRILAGKLVFDASGDFVSFNGVDRPPPGTDFCQPPFSEI